MPIEIETDPRIVIRSYDSNPEEAHTTAEHCYQRYGESLRGEPPCGNFLVIAAGDSALLDHCRKLFGQERYGEGLHDLPGEESVAWDHDADALDTAKTHFGLLMGLRTLRVYLVARNEDSARVVRREIVHVH